MDGKKLHRLNKTELLWIIRDQEEELEELRAYVKKLGGSLDGDAQEKSGTQEGLQPEAQGELQKVQEELQKAQEELQSEPQERIQSEKADRTGQGGIS